MGKLMLLSLSFRKGPETNLSFRHFSIWYPLQGFQKSQIEIGTFLVFFLPLPPIRDVVPNFPGFLVIAPLSHLLQARVELRDENEWCSRPCCGHMDRLLETGSVLLSTNQMMFLSFYLRVFNIIIVQNTSLAAKGALAHRLQRHYACNTQNGR